MFDFPSVVHGTDAYDETWNFFSVDTMGEIHFDASELQVTTSDSVPFAFCLIRCEGKSAGIVELRLTVGLEKVDGEWIITHEHHSVPTTDNKLIEENK